MVKTEYNAQLKKQTEKEDNKIKKKKKQMPELSNSVTFGKF